MKKQKFNSRNSKKNHKTLFTIISFALVVIAAAIIYVEVIRPEQLGFASNVKIDGVFIQKPTEITDFQLTDNHGKQFSKANMKGHWTMMFFGFTNCGMVCPTTLVELKKMYGTLQKDLPAKELPQVVLVSVDPERDTVERMNDYIQSYDSRFVGLRGETSETENLKKQLHIVSGKMKLDDGSNQYTINHSAEIMLFNPEGKLQAYLAYPHKAAQMVDDYELVLKKTAT